MSYGDKKDHNLFNCHEKHEINYIANQYINKLAVVDELKELCQDDIIHNSTHEEVYTILEVLGYTKKD